LDQAAAFDVLLRAASGADHHWQQSPQGTSWWRAMKTSASSFAMRSSSALIRYLVIQPRISFDCFTQFCFATLGVGDRLFLLGDHALRIVMCLDRCGECLAFLFD